MNETVKIAPASLAVNPAGSSGYIVRQPAPEAVPTAVETLEHLEQTLDNLDPVVADKAADAVIAEITGASVEAVEPVVAVPEGTEHPHGDVPGELVVEKIKPAKQGKKK